MALKFAIQTVFEIAVVILIIYGFIREDKLIAFEDRVRAKIRAKKERARCRHSKRQLTRRGAGKNGAGKRSVKLPLPAEN